MEKDILKSNFSSNNLSQRFKFIFFLLLMQFSFSANAQWLQMGTDIDGESAGDLMGAETSLSSDGNTLIASSPSYGTSQVKVYSFDGLSWDQKGQNLIGEDDPNIVGNAVSLSSDGSIMAIGEVNNDGNGDNSGHVRIYQYINGLWEQLGQDIDGEANGDQSGGEIELSEDGYTIAISATGNDDNGSLSGHVRVYEFNGESWMQKGQDLDGESETDLSGNSLSLSSDGSLVAIGSSLNDGFDVNAGHVRVYKFIGEIWVQQGEDIDGESYNEWSGFSVSLNSEGTTLAIGAVLNNANGEGAGQVKIYTWSDDNWIQVGQNIQGDSAFDGFGFSVSLSNDGMKLAIGASYSNNGGEYAGYVKVYYFDGNNWLQDGNEIVGEAVNDRSGFSVSMNSDGSVIAIGAPNNSGNGIEAGHVRVYAFDTGTAIHENSFGNTFSLSPNPANDKVNLSFGDEQVTNVSILNNVGQEVLSVKENIGSQKVISLTGLADGIYFVIVRSGDRYKVMKLVKN